jgi:hypothetical protein
MKKQFKIFNALLIILLLAFIGNFNTYAGEQPKVQVCYTTVGNNTYVSSYGNTCVPGINTCESNPCKTEDPGFQN